MPIKTLESYLFERKLANASSIEILQNATVGIDVDHYLSRIYTFKKETFLAGIGGVPASLKDYIVSDLAVFREFNIKPIFVINGLSFQLQQHRYATNELSAQEQHLDATWVKMGTKPMYQYNSMESFRIFTDPLPLRPMINDLVKYFIDIGIDYLISPYDASFQLSYLYQAGMVDAIYGSTDLLLTKIDKFILGMEFQSKDFRFIDKQKVLSELQLSERQFIDLSLMVGCTVQPHTFPNFPPLPKPNQIQPYPQLSYFKLGLDIIYHNSFHAHQNDLYGYIASMNDPKLLEWYFKGHAALNFAPVLNKEGYVEPYSTEMLKLGCAVNPDFVEDNNGEQRVKVPNNVHDVVSQRLPPEMYFYQSVGLAPLSLLEAITSGYMEVRPTLESGLSDSYKKLITSKTYTDNLDHQFNLLTQLLARYYQVKKIDIKYWFQDAVVQLNNRMTPSISRRLSPLFASGASTSKGYFSVAEFFTKPPSPLEEGAMLTTNTDVVATAFLRAMVLFDLIDQDTRKPTPSGQILADFAAANPMADEEFARLLLIFMLVQSKALVLTESNRNFTNVPKFFKEGSADAASVELTPEQLKYLTVIGRVFTLQKLNISPINYQGPISRNLLNFRSHIKFINSALASTVQANLVDLVVQEQRNKVKKTFEGKHDWYELVDQLPFFRDVNSTLLGVVAEIFFEYSFRQSGVGKPVDEVKKLAKDHLMNSVFQINSPTFNINVHGVNTISADQLNRDFDAGVAFWHKFVALAQFVHKTDPKLIDKHYLDDIIGADEWVKKFT
ncbi:post-transcriptional regulator Mkt1p [Diutina catenulata]